MLPLFITSGPPHPWEGSFIEGVDLEELLSVHNKMYYYLQERTQDNDVRSRVRVTASRIQERLQQHGARKLIGATGGGGSINMQLSAPSPAPAQLRQDIIERQQVQSQLQIQQPAQEAFTMVPSLNNSLCHSPYSRVSCISNRLHSSRAFSITHNSSLSHSTSPLQCLRLLWHLHRCRIF